MTQTRTTLVVFILVMIGTAGAILLMGMILFQGYILSTWPVLPSIWSQGLFFALLILAGGFALKELVLSKYNQIRSKEI